jgi:hypothetical protein
MRLSQDTMHLLNTTANLCALDRELTKQRREGKFGVAAGNHGDRRGLEELGLAAYELRRWRQFPLPVEFVGTCNMYLVEWVPIKEMMVLCHALLLTGACS